MKSLTYGVITVIVIILLYTTVFARQPVTIRGNLDISSAILQRWLIEIGDCPADELSRQIQQRCRQYGYYDALVTVTEDGEEEGYATLVIHEGLPVVLGKVTVDCPNEWSGEFIRHFVHSTFTGIASADQLDGLLMRTVRVMADSGYGKVRIIPGNFRRRGQELDISLFVDPGPQIRVGGWRITGLSRTDSSRVRRSLGLRTGVVWNREEKSRVQQNLAELDYLYQAGDISIAGGSDDTLVVVEIPLAERPSLVADGGIGLAGGEIGGRRWHGQFELTVENPFGGGRHMDLLISRPAENTSMSRLRVIDPEIAASGIGVSIGLEQSHEALLYDRFSAEIGGMMRISRTVRAELRFQWSRVTPLENQSSIYAARCHDVALSMGNMTGRSRPLWQSGRTLWQIGLTSSFRRDFEGSPDDNHMKSRARASATMVRNVSAGPHFGLHIRLNGESWIAPDRELRWGDELYLGGPGTIRGYAERAFRARGYAVSSVEAAYRPVIQLGMYLFSDIAYYRIFALDGPGRATRRVAGFGLGLETLNNLGRTRLELSWPEGGAFRDGIIYLRWLRGW